MGKFDQMVNSGSPAAPQGYEDRIWQPLGIPVTAVLTTATGTATLTPLTNFKGQRLITSRKSNQQFSILSMTVQGIQQMASGDPISADVFAPDSSLSDLADFSDCPAQGQIAITVKNNDTVTWSFEGGFFGWAKPRN